MQIFIKDSQLTTWIPLYHSWNMLSVIEVKIPWRKTYWSDNTMDSGEGAQNV